MTFQYDQTYAQEVDKIFGNYRDTYSSANGQVSAQLFVNGKTLTAHVSFAPGYSFESVTDKFAGDLNNYAVKHGFKGHLRIIYAES